MAMFLIANRIESIVWCLAVEFNFRNPYNITVPAGHDIACK